jgi:flagellin-specific chaperone FliS
MRRLADANAQQREEPLAEALGLLETLLEGWEGAQQQLQETQTRATEPWAIPQEQSYTPHAWNF